MNNYKERVYKIDKHGLIVVKYRNKMEGMLAGADVVPII